MTSDDLVERLKAGIVDFDLDALGPALHPDVVWGDCASRPNVLGMLATFKEQGAAAVSSSFEQLEDRIVASVEVRMGDANLMVHNAVFVEDGLIAEIVDAEDAAAARTLDRSGPFPAVAEPTGFGAVAPVLPVSDLPAAIELYERLGFEVESYDGGAFYAFASRGQVQLHLTQVDNVDPLASNVAIYLYVDDAKSLFAEWRAAGVAESQGRLHAPTNTDYGLCEGAYVDPWGNLLRFGSPIT